ncbi:hypothetical protein ACIQBJ_16095 [Kitasatospora sp. NPDC088391]|uniref:hypothetical protein n=1 Tax=Kitasatospora sp. NPDC088391 TaxID=3364074 RepID=UPI00382C322F
MSAPSNSGPAARRRHRPALRVGWSVVAVGLLVAGWPAAPPGGDLHPGGRHGHRRTGHVHRHHSRRRDRQPDHRQHDDRQPDDRRRGGRCRRRGGGG